MSVLLEFKGTSKRYDNGTLALQETLTWRLANASL